MLDEVSLAPEPLRVGGLDEGHAVISAERIGQAAAK
jgi:hypothetical protein